METRKIFWNILSVSELVFYLLTIIVLVIFAYGIYRHIRRILQGKRVSFTVRPFMAKLLAAKASIATNRTILHHDRSAGAMHLLIMWGFIVLFIGTVIVTIEYDLFQKILGQKHGFWVGPFFLGYELVLDTLGALFILGLSWALVRRYLIKPSQLTWKPLDLALPLWLLLIGITGFLVEGLRLAATAKELTYSPIWSPVGFAVSTLVQSLSSETLRSWHWTLWWIHGLLALGWVAYLPYAPKVMHILTAGVNLFFQEMRPRGRLELLDVEGAFERNEVLGYQTLKELTRKDFLDLASCTECGRCEADCPAHLSGKVLSPREIVLELRDHANREFPTLSLKGRGWRAAPGEGQKQIIGYSVKPEEIWACTTCMACVEACPVFIDPLGKILELRRNEVMIQDKYPEGFAAAFKGMDGRGNPWDMPASERLAWTKGLDVPVVSALAASNPSPDFEYLFFVGCAAAFDPRTQKIARSMVKILKAAGIKFAILGEEEGCTGDPARRIGHEYIFQQLAKQNIETFKNYSVRKILTICPHCYNTLKNEYPALGGQYEMIHHTELIGKLVNEGRLKLTKEVQATISYHDSCYLGRYNRIFEAPRNILKKIPGVKLIEMERRRERGMCCGAGGGLMWLEEEPGKRINELRVKQAQEVFAKVRADGQAKLVASACPFCMTMLEDGIKSKNAEFENKDIAELVAEAMETAALAHHQQ